MTSRRPPAVFGDLLWGDVDVVGPLIDPGAFLGFPGLRREACEEVLGVVRMVGRVGETDVMP